MSAGSIQPIRQCGFGAGSALISVEPNQLRHIADRLCTVGTIIEALRDTARRLLSAMAMPGLMTSLVGGAVASMA
jgi:hypothetical protein